GCQSWCQKKLYLKDCGLEKQGVSAALPMEFSVSQNYPNPFNPTCVIAYALPTDCQVKLSIYNILGQKVKVLVDEYQNAGYRSVTWDGKDDQGQEVSTGVYFYRVQAGNFMQSKKMVLTK
ncbi:MAG: T9SS type A sorting domain-containing protein, partial [Candidatus Aerophobus sp.]